MFSVTALRTFSDLGNCDQSTSNNTPVYSTDLYFFCVLRKLYKFKCLDKAIVLMCECKSCKIYNQNGIVSYFTLRSPVQASDFFFNNLFKFTSIHYFSRTLKNSRFTLYTPIQSSIMKRISLKKTYNTFLFFLYQTCVLMFTTSGCMCMHVSDEYGNRKKLEAHFPHKLTSIRFTDSFRNRFLL